MVVQDLFGNMPVRVKQRAAGSLENDKGHEKESERLRRQITSLLLSFHRPVSLMITTSDPKSQKFVIRHGQDTASEPSNNGIIIPSPSPILPSSEVPGPIDIALICSLLYQAGYIEPTDWKMWIKTSARTSTVSVKGAISLTPAPSKYTQFISLGIWPVDREVTGSLIYDEVNSLFAASSFGNIEEYGKLEESKWIKDRRYKQNGFTKKQLKGAGKGVDRWPMFYIRIELNNSKDVQRLERQTVLPDVVKVVSAMVHGFLKDNHFRPRAMASKREKAELRKPQFTQERTVSDTFSTWSRIKSSRSFTGFAANPSSTACQPSSYMYEESRLQTTRQKLEQVELAAATSNVASASTDQEEIVEWINPVNKVKVLVNGRTGHIVSKVLTEKRPSTAPPCLQKSSLAVQNSLTLGSLVSQNPPRCGTWASSVLAKWKNPVFSPTEEPIPKASLSDETTTVLHDCRDQSSNDIIHSASVRPTNTHPTQISKSALAVAQVISQVDKKFILISISPSQTLVLIDQHAADERIRMEALLEDINTQPPLELPKPLTLTLPAKDHALLAKQITYFTRWGINFTTTPSPLAPEAVTLATSNKNTKPPQPTITITSLPPAIAQRCLLDPQVLLTLLRTEAWNLSFSSSSPCTSLLPPIKPTSLHGPTAPTSLPPQSLLNLLASRACRSAIMFNDDLSLQESKTLVRRLAATKHPFQCAHGRPSMVPLVELGVRCAEKGAGGGRDMREGVGFDGETGEHAGSEGEGVGEGFAAAWKRWKGE